MTNVSFRLYSGDSLRSATADGRAGSLPQHGEGASNERAGDAIKFCRNGVPHGQRQRISRRLRSTRRPDGSSSVRQLPVGAALT
jgi:hypothetical protein